MNIVSIKLLQDGRPLPGPRVGSCLTLRKELSKKTHVLTKKETIGKGRRGGEQEGKGTQKNCPSTWLTVLGFMGMVLVPGFSLTNHSDSQSFLVAPALLIQFWEVVGHLASPFWPFPNHPSWWWLPSSLISTRTSCPNRTHVSVCCDAWPEWAVSVSVLPQTNPQRKSPHPRELSLEVMSTTNWRLPRAFAICLCRDWILGCCSCWPWTWPEGSSGWRMRHLVIQENW